MQMQAVELGIAQETADRLKEIEQQKIADRQQAVQQGVGLAMNLASSVQGALRQERQQELETAKARIQAMNITEEKKAELMAQAEKKNQQAAKKEKAIAIAMAIINTAMAATKALSQGGFPAGIIFAALIAAAGAIQIATIAKQKFARGGAFITNGEQNFGGAMVGDNPGGRELVQVTPLSSRNFNGPDLGTNMNIGDTNITINGNVGEKEVRDIETITRRRNRELEAMFRDTTIRTRLRIA
jgi:hypothetical protein